jgi:hypothetical protein
MPNGDDTTTVHLKDGTTLHLKGKDLSPEQVQAKVSAFRTSQAPKETPESQRPDTVKQAQETVRKPLDELQEKRYSIFTPTGISGTPEQLKQVESVQKNVAIGAGSMIGGEVAGALVPGAEAAAGSSKFLRFLLPMLARSSGAGAGAGGTALLTGSSPKEALATASQFSAMEAGGETGAKVVSKVAKPVARFMKDLAKSKVKIAEEEHAALLAKTEKAYQEKLSAHKEAKAKVMEGYKQDLQEHAAASKEASAKESAAQAKTGAALKHQNELAGLLKENLALTDERISAKLGEEFEKVHGSVEAKNPKVEISPVTKAAETARKGLLFPDSAAAFDKVMASIEPEGGTVTAARYGDVRKAYTKLNEYLYGGSEVPTDLYKAVKSVRDALGKVSQSAADSVGLGGKFSKTMREWSEYKSTFHDKSAIAKGGSPIRRILDAEDPAFVIDQLKGKAGERLVEDIGQYSKYGADKALAGRLRGFIEQVKGMPASAGAKLESPKRPEIPKAPVKEDVPPFDRKAAARKQAIDIIRKAGIGGAAIVGAELVYHLLTSDSKSKGAPLP